MARLQRCVAWVGASRQDRDGLTAPQKPPCEEKGQQQLQQKKGLFALKNEVHFGGCSFFFNTEKVSTLHAKNIQTAQVIKVKVKSCQPAW